MSMLLTVATPYLSPQPVGQTLSSATAPTTMEIVRSQSEGRNRERVRVRSLSNGGSIEREREREREREKESEIVRS